MVADVSVIKNTLIHVSRKPQPEGDDTRCAQPSIVMLKQTALGGAFSVARGARWTEPGKVVGSGQVRECVEVPGVEAGCEAHAGD